MKKFLFLILLFLFPIFINAKSVNPSFVEYDYFYKLDEQNNVIENAEFKLRDLDNKTSIDVLYDSNNKMYKYIALNVTENANDLLNLLPNKYKTIIEGLKNADGFERIITPEE